MDDLAVQTKARAFIDGLDLLRIREDLGVYVEKLEGKVIYQELGEGESGYTVMKRGKPQIVVNSLESAPRQRFTICHEIAHVVLELESSHEEVKSWSYVKRHQNEIWCDIFAAELLMPFDHFKSDVDGQEPSLQLIDLLAGRYSTSFPAGGSRLASLCDWPCSFVFMERGSVRYASMSTSLRNMRARIASKSPIPPGSAAYELRTAGGTQSPQREVAQDIWFPDWANDVDLFEVARHYQQYDQTFSLLWFEEDGIPRSVTSSRARLLTAEKDGLDELTGHLPWKNRR